MLAGLLVEPNGEAQELFLDLADKLKKEVKNYEGTESRSLRLRSRRTSTDTDTQTLRQTQLIIYRTHAKHIADTDSYIRSHSLVAAALAAPPDYVKPRTPSAAPPVSSAVLQKYPDPNDVRIHTRHTHTHRHTMH